MRNLLLIVCFVASAICASAQKVYFIYLQSDNNSPFYVKMNDRIYSSATSGYLILSNLVDSTYNFSIGFPSAQSESRFAVTLGAKDRGFLIKNFESGLGLFDLQDLTIISQQKDESAKNISYIKRDDGFASLLSKAAKDTSLLYAVVRIKEKEDVSVKEPSQTDESKQTAEATSIKDTIAASSQTDTARDTKKQDSVAAQSGDETKKEDGTASSALEELQKDTVAFEQKEPLKQTADDTVVVIDTLSGKTEKPVATSTAEEEQKVFKRSLVKKYSESSTSEGFGLVYYDIYGGGSDTIRLLIPNPPIIFRQPNEDSSSLVQKGFIHVEDLKKDTEQPVVEAVKNNAPVKAHCRSSASNNDFFRLRKNMAAENTDEGMVGEAKKVFKSKCFTTEQIKNLGALFLTSAGKYQFFDAAYLHVSDQENFSSLESEIKDDYYLKRFKALVDE